MSSPPPVTFYDITAKDGVGPWSPNTWKTRLALNYKGVPYKTEFVSYPDIKARMQEIGADIGYKASYGEVYTLPVIADHAANKVVTDSRAIALHLDAHHPGPKLFPVGTRAFQTAFIRWHGDNIFNDVATIVCMSCPAALDERGAEYFTRTRNEWYGDPPLEEWVKDRKEHWLKIRMGYGKLAAIYDEAEEEFGAECWLMGPAPTFADFVVASTLIWIKKLIKEPGEGWEAISKWHGGRWERFLKQCEPYMAEN